jgi:hypothetical protein
VPEGLIAKPAYLPKSLLEQAFIRMLKMRKESKERSEREGKEM